MAVNQLPFSFSSADKAVILWNLVSSEYAAPALCFHGDPRVNEVRSKVHCIHVLMFFSLVRIHGNLCRF